MKQVAKDRTLIFAHRGAKRAAPENTLPAFEAAVRLDADGVEFDVQYSSDGQLVIFHDFSLEKTSNGTGRVSAHTLAELRELDAGLHFGPEFAGTRIPTLDEVLDLLKDKLLVNIELKSVRASNDGLGQDVAKKVLAHGMAGQVVISSFNPFALRRSKLTGPQIEHALLLADDSPGWMKSGLMFRWSKAEALHPESVMVTPEYVVQARRRGLPVRVWTVNEPEEMRRLAGLGVDAIVTDAPDLARQVLGY